VGQYKAVKGNDKVFLVLKYHAMKTWRLEVKLHMFLFSALLYLNCFTHGGKASDTHCVGDWRKVIWCSLVLYSALAYTKYCSLNKSSESEV